MHMHTVYSINIEDLTNDESVYNINTNTVTQKGTREYNDNPCDYISMMSNFVQQPANIIKRPFTVTTQYIKK